MSFMVKQDIELDFSVSKAGILPHVCTTCVIHQAEHIHQPCSDLPGARYPTMLSTPRKLIELLGGHRIWLMTVFGLMDHYGSF